MMEIKAVPRASAHVVGLAYADQQIQYLFQKHLPATPHIFTVPTNNPFLPNFPHENRNIPFERCEIPKLQYMTLISNGDRGVGASRGASDWEDEIYGKSPLSAAAHSSTSTPNPARDPKKPSQKISFGDYKNYKQTGVKPSPRPYTATPELRAKQDAPGHSRNTSAVSAITPMDRVPSAERGDHNLAIANLDTITVEMDPIQIHERSTVPPTASTDAENPRPTTNGHHLTTTPNTAKDSNVEGAPLKTQLAHPLKEITRHPLPPRPQSPPRSNPELKKRPLESGGIHAEERVKISHVEPKTLSGSQKGASRKPENAASEIKPPHSKSQTVIAVPLPKKPTATAKPIDVKAQAPKSSKSSSDKPLEIPPLLSPLPADLEPLEPHSRIKKSESEKVTPPKTPSHPQKGDNGSDTIVVKQPNARSRVAASSPLSDPPPFILPPLLSPGLPPVVEEELARLQQKSATLNTVEARHEKARMPDAPGVARKMERNAKVGHPPKRNHAESSSKLATVPEKEVKKSLVVKIPYKKRTAIHIQRILALTQKPRGQMEKLQAGERRARERSTSAAPPTQNESESEDLPLSKSKTSAPVSTTGSKKRPFDSVDRDVGKKNPNRSRTQNDADTRSEPTAKRSKLHDHNHSDAVSDAAKRSKLPDPNRSNATSDSIERNVEKKNPKRANNLDASDLRSGAGAKRSKLEIDVAKAATPVAPAFKSPSNPATATISQKSLLATPKKGDALKSVAMRRADSNENLARTPQTTSASTPASTEKHRPNGGDMRPSTDRPSEVKAPMIEKLKADDAKLYPLGTILKRKMDSIVNPRKRDTSAPASDLELKAGFCIGVESLMAYMLAFEARDRVASIRSLPRDPSVWEGFIGLQEFLFKTAKPYAELHALIEVMGGVAREMLNNSYMDHAGLVKDRDGAQKIIGKMKENCRAREIAWKGASQNETVLNDLGVMNDKQHRLGIWSGVDEAVAFAAETLALYAARENLDWTPEPGLARD